MRAIVYDEPWKMSVKEVPYPEFEDDSDIIVKVGAVGICGSDIHGYTGATGRRCPGVIMGEP